MCQLAGALQQQSFKKRLCRRMRVTLRCIIGPSIDQFAPQNEDGHRNSSTDWHLQPGSELRTSKCESDEYSPLQRTKPMSRSAKILTTAQNSFSARVAAYHKKLSSNAAVMVDGLQRGQALAFAPSVKKGNLTLRDCIP